MVKNQISPNFVHLPELFSSAVIIQLVVKTLTYGRTCQISSALLIDHHTNNKIDEKIIQIN